MDAQNINETSIHITKPNKNDYIEYDSKQQKLQPYNGS